MQPENPYATPTAPLLEPPRATLPGWRAGQLRVLAALCLGEVLATLLMSVAALLIDPLHRSLLGLSLDWLGPLASLLGCYLLIRFKAFVQARFSARGLTRPTWALVIMSLLVTALEVALGDAVRRPAGWAAPVYFGGVALYGVFTLWFGLRLLKVRDVYVAVRVMAWLAIVGGAALASVILALGALLPLLGMQLAMMAVFLRGAAERARADAP